MGGNKKDSVSPIKTGYLPDFPRIPDNILKNQEIFLVVKIIPLEEPLPSFNFPMLLIISRWPPFFGFLLSVA
jgi:hypothetical protein